MPDESPFYALRNIPLTDSGWTPIVAPIDCNAFAVQSPGDIKIRTDHTNPATENLILQGMQEYILAPWESSGYRFPKGSTIACLQSVSGTTTAIVTFVC